MTDLGIIRSILDGEDECMSRRRWQDPKIEIRRDVKRPFYYIRPYVPRITPDGIVRKQEVIRLGFVDETTKRDAQAKKREIMDSINEGRVIIKSQIPFSDVTRKFLEARVPLLGAGTQEKYKTHIRNHVLPAFGKLRLVDIDQPTIQAWILVKRDEGLSWWTRNDLRNLLSAIFTAAKLWKLWDGDNPVTAIEIGPKEDKREKKLLNADDLRRLLAALDPQDKLIVLIAFATGLRISEILGLKWADIDFTKETVTVSRRWSRGNMANPKTAASRRVRKLGPAIADLKRVAGCPDDWIFPGHHGQPEDDRDFQKRLRATAKTLGFHFAGFGAHTFRRQHISWKQDAGAHPFEAMKAAGHSKPDTTWMYTIADSERETEQLDKMFERLVGDPETTAKPPGKKGEFSN